MNDVATALTALGPRGVLHVPGVLLGAYYSKNAKTFILDNRFRTAAVQFGALHQCNFHFDSSEGVGTFTKRWAS